MKHLGAIRWTSAICSVVGPLFLGWSMHHASTLSARVMVSVAILVYATTLLFARRMEWRQLDRLIEMVRESSNPR